MKTLQISDVVFATDCSQLMKIMFLRKEWSTFMIYIEEFVRCKKFFPNFITKHIARAQNTLTDKHERGAQCLPSVVSFITSDLANQTELYFFLLT